VNDYIRIEDKNDFDLDREFTLSAWTKLSTLNKWAYLFDK